MVGSCTLSAGKIFAAKARLFCLCFGFCFCFCMFFWRCLLLVCGALLHGLWCASMLVVVQFGGCWAVATVKECVQKEGDSRLSPSSTNVASCGQVETVELEHANPVCL